jgi:CelD/BcsL family acetyltransferase involved in cellulose biosynthesis
MGYWQPTLERLARNDKLVRFRTRGRPDKFQGKETTIFLDDEVVSSGVDDSHMGFKGRRNPPKWQFG